MSRKPKYTPEQKIQACEDYLSGRKSPTQIIIDLNMPKKRYGILTFWVRKYKAYGAIAFMHSKVNSNYSKELKLKVIRDYQLKGLSIPELAVKYNIRAISTVSNWILKYNSDIELDDYFPKPEVYSMKHRKTTINERLEIINWCIENNYNYKEAASRFNCNYAQVYDWVKKYKLDGEDGLMDRRGKRKDIGDLTSEEKLKKENEKLKQRNEDLERTIILLKKLNAFEWKD